MGKLTRAVVARSSRVVAWLLCGSLAAMALACKREPAPASVPTPETPADSTAQKLENEQRSIGAERYGRMCAVCHGPNGEGYRADEAPALAHPAFLGSVSDEFLRVAIANGRTGTTMSAWSSARMGPLSSTEIDAIVRHIRGWQKEPAAALDERPPSGDLERGTALYVSQCQRCHGPRGTGGKHTRLGDPAYLASASNGFLRLAIAKGRPGTPMPAFGETLGEQAVEDLMTYLRSLQGDPTPFEPARSGRPPPLPLGPVPIHARGPEPQGFAAHPDMTAADRVHGQLQRKARFGILDARAPSDYVQEHIAGAVSVPFYDPAPYLSQLPKDTWLICYCACPHAESGILAQKLKENGFTKVSVMNEGLLYWKDKGYPMRSGAQP